MHVYGTYTYAGSYMHPVHCKQEMLLNLRVCGDSQNLIGQEILRSSYCTNKKNRYLVQIFERGGGCLVRSQTLLPKYLYRDIPFKPLIYLHCHI